MKKICELNFSASNLTKETIRKIHVICFLIKKPGMQQGLLGNNEYVSLFYLFIITKISGFSPYFVNSVIYFL